LHDAPVAMAPGTKRSRATGATKAAKKQAIQSGEVTTEAATPPTVPTRAKSQGLQRWFGGGSAKDAKAGEETSSIEVSAKKPATTVQYPFAPVGQKQVEITGSKDVAQKCKPPISPEQQQQHGQSQRQQQSQQPQQSQQQPPLNEEQQRRIEENRRKALERQRAKRGVPTQEPATDSHKLAVASPVKPAALETSSFRKLSHLRR